MDNSAITLQTVFSLHPAVEKYVKDLIFIKDMLYSDAIIAALRKIDEKARLTFTEDLSNDEIAVLTYINSNFSVQEIIENTNIEEKIVLRILEDFERRDIIRKKRGYQDLSDSKSWQKRIQIIFFLVCFLSIITLLGFNAYDRYRQLNRFTIPFPDAGKILISNFRLNYLKKILNLYELENNHYPDKLKDLVTSNYIKSTDLYYPFMNEYHYQKKTDSYEIHLPEF